MLYIVFNGRWNAHNKYVDHEIKLLMVHKDIKFLDLVDKIHNLLNLNRNLVSINILFDVNMGTSKGMKIESDMDLEAYLIENNTKEDLRNCPLIVEVIEKNQTMALSRTTSIAATTSASNATSRKKTAASSSAYSGTNSTSSRASCMATEGGQEVQSPLTVLPSMGIEDLRVNHMFKNKEELKSALSRIAIKKHFQYKVKRSCSLTFWAKCIDENCEWYLRARSSKTSSYFRVIKYKNFHSCSLNHKSTDNRQASAKVISDCIKEKIRDPKTNYKTRQIINDMRDEYGVQVKYNKAWRAKELAKNNVRGSYEESYAELPAYLHMLKLSNPGTITRIEKDDDNRFKYMFLAFGCSLDGWKHCRPVVVVDGTFLKAKCGGTLYAACAKDGNNQIFPLAFGIGDSENDKAWKWFFKRLKEAIGEREEMCIISDRHISIKNAIAEVFPRIYHGICAYHLKQNLRSRFRGVHVQATFEIAARSYSVPEYDSAMAELRNINPEITTYLLEADPKRWARSFFPKRRYNIMTSNISESINSTIEHARDLPITPLVEALREMVQDWFSRRKEAATCQFFDMTKWANDVMESKLDQAFRMKVDKIDMFKYQVTYGDTTFIVDLTENSCSCKEFQLEGIPCAHAIAAIDANHFDKYKFCSEWYSKSVLLETYAGSVNPLPNKEDWNTPDEIKEDRIKPPEFKVKPGRPKKRRGEGIGDYAKRGRRRTMTCGNSGILDHNKKSCNHTTNQF
ncbi:uncharacterized protein LOC115712279 [Cannabis sativa]|uniref:uncharacterized protein LOC115712279 n=1 Tax=Cannabis sativa TaxID=3483 RepID=UPI0029CA4E2E|nr:uncharacterized protein LOC115712279 [Cannabis sativa]